MECHDHDVDVDLMLLIFVSDVAFTFHFYTHVFLLENSYQMSFLRNLYVFVRSLFDIRFVKNTDWFL